MAYNAIGAIIAIEKKAQEIIAPATKAQESLADDICAEKENRNSVYGYLNVFVDKRKKLP